MDPPSCHSTTERIVNRGIGSRASAWRRQVSVVVLIWCEGPWSAGSQGPSYATGVTPKGLGSPQHPVGMSAPISVGLGGGEGSRDGRRPWRGPPAWLELVRRRD